MKLLRYVFLRRVVYKIDKCINVNNIKTSLLSARYNHLANAFVYSQNDLYRFN